MIKQASKSLATLFCLTLIGYLTQFALNTFLARHLSEALYGDFNLAINILSIFATLILFGSTVGGYRFLSKFIKLKQFHQAIKYIAWNLKLVSLNGVIGLTISLFACIMMLLLHYLGMKDINSYHLVVYTLWLFPFVASALLLYTYLGSANQVIIGSFYMSVMIYLIQISLFVVLVFLFDPLLHNTNLIAVLLLSYIVILGCSFSSINRQLYDLFLPSIKISPNVPIGKQNASWLKTNAKLSVNVLLYTLINANGLIVIEIVSNNESDLGYYSAALIITGIITVLFNGLYLKLNTEVSTLLAKKKTHGLLQAQLNHTNAYSFILLLIMGLAIVGFEKHILLLFGPTYLHAEWVVTILLLAIMIDSYAGVGSRFLLYGGYETISLKIKIIECLLSLMLMIVLTLVWGIIGTAIAASLTAFIKLSMNVYLCRTKLGIRILYFV